MKLVKRIDEDTYYFWKIGEIAQKKVEQWPEWKRNIKLDCDKESQFKEK